MSEGRGVREILIRVHLFFFEDKQGTEVLQIKSKMIKLVYYSTATFVMCNYLYTKAKYIPLYLIGIFVQ